MKEGTETALYNQGYMDGFDDAVKSEIEKVKPKLKDVKEKSFPKDEPDYWTRLEHQAAIAAMQGFLAGQVEATYERVAEFSINQAHALVEMMKDKEERK